MPVMLLVLLWPLIEIAGFVWVGGAIGVVPTLGLVLVSAFAGLALLRRAGITTLMQLGARVEAGETPLPAALDGAWQILAGALLVVPGLFSSILALVLLLPPVRALLTGLAQRRLRPGPGGVRIYGFGATIRRKAGPEIIEGEFSALAPLPPELPPAP